MQAVYRAVTWLQVCPGAARPGARLGNAAGHHHGLTGGELRMNISGGERWLRAALASLTVSLLHLLVGITMTPCLMGKFGTHVGEKFLCAVIMGGR